MKANSTKLDETYRIHFEKSDGAPMGLEDVEAGGFVLIAMHEHDTGVIIHNTNLENIALAIARCAELRAAAKLAEGYVDAHAIVKEDKEDKMRNAFADMFMGIGKDDD